MLQILRPLLIFFSISLLAACGSGDSTAPAPNDSTSGTDQSNDGSTGGSNDDGSGDGTDDGTGDGTDDGSDDGSGDGTDDGAGDGTDDGSGDGTDDGSGGTDDGSGGGDDGSAGDTLPATFASLQCDTAAGGPISGPLDPAQTEMRDQLAARFADVPELGASAASLVSATARFLDIVDAMAASGNTLFAEQDPAAGGEALEGGALAVQCGSKSLAEAYTNSPLAEALPVSSAQLVQQLAELTLIFDGPDSIGMDGLQELTTRLSDIAQTMSSMAGVLEGFPELLPASVADATGPLPAEGFFALLNAPADAMANIATILDAAGQLQGQQTADAIAVTLSDLTAQASAFDTTGTLGSGLGEAQTQLANGLALILPALFDAISEGLGNIDTETFSDFLAGGIDGFPSGQNPLEVLLGGNMSGFESLESLLAEVPVLGEVAGLLMASAGEDFNFADPTAPTQLLTTLLAGNGPEGFEDLLSTLQSLGSQVQAIAPAGMLPGNASGFPTDAAALGSVLTALEGNSGAALLGELSEALGGSNVPAYTPEDLAEALSALFSEIDAGADGGLLGSVITALSDLVNGLLAALGDNPLASLVTGVLGEFSTQNSSLEVSELDAALTELLDGLGAFAP